MSSCAGKKASGGTIGSVPLVHSCMSIHMELRDALCGVDHRIRVFGLLYKTQEIQDQYVFFTLDGWVVDASGS